MKKQRIEPETLILYQQVKDHIIGKINGGLMQAGMRIESEAELVASLNVSRMTVKAVSITPVPVILWVEILSRHQSGALGLHDLHCQE